MSVRAVILVGGETTGTRFRPLTMDLPKCLFPIAGKPLISHIIDNLVAQLGSSLTGVFLVSFFKQSAKFDEYIAKQSHHYPDLDIRYLAEPYPMGTGGGLYFYRNTIMGLEGTDDKIFVIHGDVICNYPFKGFVDFVDASGADASILGISPLRLVDDALPLPTMASGSGHDSASFFEKDKILRSYGTVISDKKSHDVVHYVEKPKSDSFAKFQDSDFDIHINGGIYLFRSSIFKLLANAQASKLLDESYVNHDELDDDDEGKPNSNILSFELDIFKTLPANENFKFSTYVSDSFWYQLKTPIFALFANNFFLQQENKELLLAASANVIAPVKADSLRSKDHSYQLGPNVSIGKNVVIGNGVRLKNCIISNNVTIDDHSIVVNAIVSEGVKIGKWCRIEGTVNRPTINKDISQLNADNYLKLINNVVVLCRDTVVGNQVFVYNSIVLPHKELKRDVKYEIVM